MDELVALTLSIVFPLAAGIVIKLLGRWLKSGHVQFFIKLDHPSVKFSLSVSSRKSPQEFNKEIDELLEKEIYK